MTTRLVPTTRKPQVVWAVVSKDKTDRVIHATGLSKEVADAIKRERQEGRSGR